MSRCRLGRDQGEAIIAVAVELAQAIVRDGEGATKFITVAVEGGKDAKNAARSVTPSATRRWSRPPSSPPTPTSAASSPPSATPASPTSMSMASRSGSDEVLVAENGGRAAAYREGSRWRPCHGAGRDHRPRRSRSRCCQANVYTCDFSYDYVKINADYRS
jgi:glutamate N-acetyltransferase/amino-acid N-acetyltransferase